MTVRVSTDVWRPAVLAPFAPYLMMQKSWVIGLMPPPPTAASVQLLVVAPDGVSHAVCRSS